MEKQRPSTSTNENDSEAAIQQIRMFDQQFYESKDGETVFVESKGDYIAAEGNKHYTNIYVFKFVARHGLLEDVLLFSGKRASEVAFLCGYKSVAAFSTAFRRTVGSSPAAYAKRRSARPI